MLNLLVLRAFRKGLSTRAATNSIIAKQTVNDNGGANNKKSQFLQFLQEKEFVVPESKKFGIEDSICFEPKRISSFLSQVKNMIQYYDIASKKDSRKLMFISTSGPPRQFVQEWFENLGSDEFKFEIFREDFIKEYADGADYDIVKNAGFNKLKQRGNQSVDNSNQFFLKCLTLSEVEMNESTKVYSYTEALIPSLRYNTKTHLPSKLEDAMRIAKLYESRQIARKRS